MSPGELVEFLESVRFEPVVRFENTDVFAAGFFEPLVHGITITGIFLVNNDDTRVFFGIFFNNVKRAVGRTVVETDDFEVAQSLADNAVQTLTQVFLDVIDRDKHGEFRVHKVIIAWP